jgi:hypothetical protein
LEQVQAELPLPFPELSGDLPLLPARMVNEYQYGPRLAYLKWVQGEWSDSADTVEGRFRHRRVDKPGGELPPPEELGEGEKLHAHSITLSSNRLELILEEHGYTCTQGILYFVESNRPHGCRTPAPSRTPSNGCALP